MILAPSMRIPGLPRGMSRCAKGRSGKKGAKDFGALRSVSAVSAGRGEHGGRKKNNEAKRLTS